MFRLWVNVCVFSLVLCGALVVLCCIALVSGYMLHSAIILFSRSGCFYELDITHGIERPIPLCGFYPAWSPDGQHLAFIGGTRIEELELYVAPMPYAAGDALQQITHDLLPDYAPAWSPDGTQLAFWEYQPQSNRWDLLVADVQSGSITSTRAMGTFEVGYPTLAWSPDGRWLAFGAGRFSTGIELYRMDVQSGLVQRLTDNLFRDDSPAWSPDSQQLVFTSAEDGYNRLYVLNLETDERRLLTSDTFGYMPAWSLDGTQIVYGANHGDEWNDLFVINTDGTGLRQITYHSDASGVDEAEPEWMP